MAILVFVFVGAGIFAMFSAFKNALYDLKFIYLVIWVAFIPIADLLILTLKPEKMPIKSQTKIKILATAIALNIIFALQFFVFEFISPDFLVRIGKPVFLIAFSVSLPIEPLVLLAIMAISTLVMTARLILVVKKRKSV